MKRHLVNVLLAVLLFFFPYALHSMEVKSLMPIDGIWWIVETTKGHQNVKNNLMSKEDGEISSQTQSLSFQGILIHTYYKNRLMTKAQLNVGFAEKKNFLWTENPDFYHGSDLNNLVRCIDFDYQKMFPIPFEHGLTLLPYVGYSYFKITFEPKENAINSNSTMYNSFVGGVQLFWRYNSRFACNTYVSYSPVVFLNYSFSTIQFLNYGFELITDTNPIAITVFLSAKRAFLQKGVTWFNDLKLDMDTMDFGFSIHLRLR